MSLKKYPLLRRKVLWLTGKYWFLREKYFQNYVFIHIPKNGGRSIEKALGCLYRHRTAADVRDYLSRECYESKFSFAFVRNPWDRAVSHYSYLKQTGQDYIEAEDLSFKRWVELVFRERHPRYMANPLHMSDQTSWITDKSGATIVDFVGRFENFAKDFGSVCEKIQLDRKLPHVNKSNREDYRQYYDGESRSIVADFFVKDVETFEYRF